MGNFERFPGLSRDRRREVPNELTVLLDEGQEDR